MDDRAIVLSVIIPVYNAEKTLENTVKSILVQKGISYEIILVNDGSSDKSAELCDSLMQQHDNIKVLHQENKGSLWARLNGTKKAMGQHVMYVDADDYIYEGAFEHFANDLIDGADLYIYDYDMEKIGGQSTKTIKAMPLDTTTTFVGEEKKSVISVFMDGWINTVCATIFKKELISEEPFVNIGKKLTNGEDRLQKMFSLIKAQKINYVPYSFYHYCWNAGSQGENLRKGIFSEQLYMQFKETWSIERKYYSELGFSENECLNYDLKKLNRICATLETSYNDKGLSDIEFRRIVGILAHEQFFNELAHTVVNRARRHLKISVKYILKNQWRGLKRYWSFCNIIRRLKYGRR